VLPPSRSATLLTKSERYSGSCENLRNELSFSRRFVLFCYFFQFFSSSASDVDLGSVCGESLGTHESDASCALLKSIDNQLVSESRSYVTDDVVAHTSHEAH